MIRLRSRSLHSPAARYRRRFFGSHAILVFACSVLEPLVAANPAPSAIAFWRQEGAPPPTGSAQLDDPDSARAALRANELSRQGSAAAAEAIALGEIDRLRRETRPATALRFHETLAPGLRERVALRVARARLLADLARYPDAFDVWRTLFAENSVPREGPSTDWVVDAAAVAWEVGRSDWAIELLRSVSPVGADPQNGPLGQAGLLLARVLLWEGRSAEALPVLRALRRSGEGGVLIALNYARALEGALLDGSGNWAEIAAAYEEAVAIAPQHAEAWLGLFRALSRSGAADAAGQARTRYEELYREDQERIRDRGVQEATLREARQQREGPPADPRSALGVLAGLPATVEVLEERSRCHEAIGDYDTAALELQRAIALAPRRTDLQLRLQQLLRRQLDP